MARFDEHMERQASGDPGKLESLCARIERLQEQVDKLDLHMEAEDGGAIGTSWISIEDFSLELGEHEREVTIQVDSHQTYVQFFA